MKIILLILLVIFSMNILKPELKAQEEKESWWQFQSIDTMKYSRDIAREKLNDKEFEKIIDRQVKLIADTGATHVGIATPYDAEFLPFLNSWVATARKYGLNVWFRGNWSGWEGWFGYKKIGRDEHISKTKDFIENNRDLFKDGDVFSACPECENGGPGDPRNTRDVKGHREFLIKEYQMTKDMFTRINKNVKSNYLSMNGDIARLVMDKDTSTSLDSVVTIDHYVKTPEILEKDIKDLAEKSGSKIVLGEFGAPIPDIHGKMTDQEQAQWINEALTRISNLPQIEGISYWVNTGGSTELWTDSGEPKPGVSVLRQFFKPEVLSAQVLNRLDQPVGKAEIYTTNHHVVSDKNGNFKIPVTENISSIKISGEGYIGTSVLPTTLRNNNKIFLDKSNPGLLFKIMQFLSKLF